MGSINVHEAKTHLSRLLARVEAGESLVISRAGRPIARLVPFDERREPRRPGRWAGRVRIADDFDETPESLLDAFES
jgi:prevent-host-death family protein